MCTDDIINYFDEIEAKIERIISQSNNIRDENDKLRKLNDQFERELINRNDEKKMYDEEQSIIRLKLEKLLQRLSSSIE